jgi:hypothetical protein
MSMSFDVISFIGTSNSTSDDVFDIMMSLCRPLKRELGRVGSPSDDAYRVG